MSNGEKRKKCVVEYCQTNRVERNKYCPVHKILHDIARKTTRFSEAAFERNDLLLGTAGYVIAKLAGPDMLGRAVTKLITDDKTGQQLPPEELQRRFFAQYQRYRQYQQQQKRDPFAELGLDATATKNDVRQRQRQLAAVWHADKTRSRPAEERLKAVNEAAAECLKILREKIHQD